MRRVMMNLLVAVLVAGVLLPAPAWACTCIMRSTVELFEDADVVFAGSVSLVETEDDERRATFALQEIFKGRLPRVVPVSTHAQSSVCGSTFVAGGEYTVFGALTEGGVRTDLCAGTSDDGRTRAQARALGAEEGGAAVVDPSDGAQAAVVGEDPGPSRAGPIAAAALLLAVTLVAMWRIAARRPMLRARRPG